MRELIEDIQKNGIKEPIKYINFNGEKFVVADDYCARTMSLPMHPYLSEEEQQIIIDAVLEAL